MTVQKQSSVQLVRLSLLPRPCLGSRLRSSKAAGRAAGSRRRAAAVSVRPPGRRCPGLLRGQVPCWHNRSPQPSKAHRFSPVANWSASSRLLPASGLSIERLSALQNADSHRRSLLGSAKFGRQVGQTLERSVAGVGGIQTVWTAN